MFKRKNYPPRLLQSWCSQQGQPTMLVVQNDSVPISCWKGANIMVTLKVKQVQADEYARIRLIANSKPMGKLRMYCLCGVGLRVFSLSIYSRTQAVNIRDRCSQVGDRVCCTDLDGPIAFSVEVYLQYCFLLDPTRFSEAGEVASAIPNMRARQRTGLCRRLICTPVQLFYTPAQLDSIRLNIKFQLFPFTFLNQLKN